MKRKILLALLVILVGIQFIQPAKNRSQSISEKDISRIYPVPQQVEVILKKTCYDCHSNNTEYPWYSYIQPVGWWLANHVNEGKEELNFAEFGGYEPVYQYRRLNAVIGTVKENEMPLNSYTWIHRDASLNNDEKTALSSWAQDLRAQIKKQFNLPDDRR